MLDFFTLVLIKESIVPIFQLRKHRLLEVKAPGPLISVWSRAWPELEHVLVLETVTMPLSHLWFEGGLAGHGWPVVAVHGGGSWKERSPSGPFDVEVLCFPAVWCVTCSVREATCPSFRHPLSPPFSGSGGQAAQRRSGHCWDGPLAPALFSGPRGGTW